MKSKYVLLAGFLFLHIAIRAQVKIGDNSTSINSASLLELESTNKGFVLPRVSLTSISSSSPLAASLLTGTVVFNTNANITSGSGVGLYYWNGSSWTAITPTISTSAWNLTGNASTTAASNFIGTTDAVDFIAKTNNIERLRITSDGNVGIGLSNPAYALSILSPSNPLYLSGVQATLTLSSDSVVTINGGVVKKTPYSSFTNAFWGLTGNAGTTASNNFIGTTDAADFIARTNNLERLRITSSGNIGIGLSNPSYALSVLSASNPLYLSGVQATTTFTSDSLLTIDGGVVKKAPYSSLNGGQNWSTTGNTATVAGTNFIGTTDAIDFITKTNNTERMRVTTGGNVGINTPNPGSTLDVKGTMRLSGSTSGYVGLAPASAAGSVTYTLPSADGVSGQALTTNGSATLSWANTAATIGTIGTGATIPGTATGKYYCTGSYITLPPGKFIVNIYMMLSSTANPMTQTTSNQPGSFFIKSFFADASLGTVAGATISPALPQTNVSSDVVGNGKLISGSLNVGQTYNAITGFVVINNTSGANKTYYYWAGWVALTNISSSNSLPLIGGTNYGEDNIVAYPTN